MATRSDPTATEHPTTHEPVSEKPERAEETTPSNRDEMAARVVDRFSVYAGAAGLIPVPFLDLATIGAVQLQMLRRLSEIYGVPFSENRGKAVLASLVGAIVPASTGVGIGSMLKSIPGFGTSIGAAVVPLASAGATWIIGKTFIQHFVSGGTLLDFNPPDYREFIKAQKEKWKARSSGSTPAEEHGSVTSSHKPAST